MSSGFSPQYSVLTVLTQIGLGKILAHSAASVRHGLQNVSFAQFQVKISQKKMTVSKHLDPFSAKCFKVSCLCFGRGAR